MHPRSQLLAGRLCSKSIALRPAISARRGYAAVASDLELDTEIYDPLQTTKTGDLGSHLPKHVIPKDAIIPPYPYGEYLLFKQSNRALYGGQRIQFGNNVSRKTETKTRRHWKPNVLRKSLYSVALKKKIKLRLTSKVFKIIDREGGLDEYLLKDNEARIKELGPLGWALRWTLMQKPEVIERMRADAAALGLDQATIDQQWPTRQMLADRKAAQKAPIIEAQLDLDAETEGQEMWQPEEDDFESESRPKLTGAIPKAARKEYAMAVKAAERYLNGSVVPTIEEGLKLAFFRSKDRADAHQELQKKFQERLQAMFTEADLAEVRESFSLPPMRDDQVRKIAYNQWRRAEIAKYGNYEAWREAQRNAKRIAEPNDSTLSRQSPEAAYTQLISATEDNTSLDAKQRRKLTTALEKAERAIQARFANGEEDYVVMAVANNKKAQKPKSRKVEKKTAPATVNPWAALLSKSNNASARSVLDA